MWHLLVSSVCTQLIQKPGNDKLTPSELIFCIEEHTTPSFLFLQDNRSFGNGRAQRESSTESAGHKLGKPFFRFPSQLTPIYAMIHAIAKPLKKPPNSLDRKLGLGPKKWSGMRGILWLDFIDWGICLQETLDLLTFDSPRSRICSCGFSRAFPQEAEL